MTLLSQPRISHIIVTYTVQMNTKVKSSYETKLAEVIDQNTWMEPAVLARVVTRVQHENASVASRRVQLMHLADRFNAALAPHTACREGCSHCCHMPTMIYTHEAEQLAAASGRSLAQPPLQRFDRTVESAKSYYGVACPFLISDRCSVYEVRPLICRLHHSLNDNPDDCSVEVPLAQRIPIASYDVDVIEVPYHELMTEKRPAEVWACIHEFFPA